MLVKVCVEQRLQSEHGITHGTLIDHPERQKKSVLKKALGVHSNVRDSIYKKKKGWENCSQQAVTQQMLSYVLHEAIKH